MINKHIILIAYIVSTAINATPIAQKKELSIPQRLFKGDKVSEILYEKVKIKRKELADWIIELVKINSTK